MERACIENWALDDILKIHTTASKASELMRFARLLNVLNKLRSSLERSEAIENLSHSLVEELVRGPIAETIARSRSRVNRRSSGRHCMVEGVEVAGAQ